MSRFNPGVYSRLAVALALVFVTSSRLSHAAKDEQRLSLSLGGTWLEHGGWGPAIRAGYGYQFAESFELDVGASGRGHLSESQDVYFGGASLGLVYKLDILEWVPSAGVAAVLLGVKEESGTHGFGSTEFAVRPSLGLDRLLSRQWSIGGRVTTDFFVGDASKLTFNNVAILARVAYVWGW